MKSSRAKYASFLKFGAVMGVVGMAVLLSACGDEADVKSNASQAVQPEAKTLKVAVTATRPPFAFIDDKGSPIGFDVDIITHIANKNGHEIKFNILPWQDLFTSVESGQSDITISAILYSVERDGKYLLSNPYTYMPPSILSLEKTDISSVEDLKPLRLGMLSGTVFQNFASANGINNVVFQDKNFLNFKDLVRGDVEAVIAIKQILEHMTNNHSGYQFKFLDVGDVNDKGSYAVALTTKNKTELMEMFNAGIADMKASGEFARIEKKWFGDTTKVQ